MRNFHGKINKNSLESLIQKIPIRFMMQRWYEGVAESLLELFQELETRESIGAQKKWTLETSHHVEIFSKLLTSQRVWKNFQTARDVLVRNYASYARWKLYLTTCELFWRQKLGISRNFLMKSRKTFSFCTFDKFSLFIWGFVFMRFSLTTVLHRK